MLSLTLVHISCLKMLKLERGIEVFVQTILVGTSKLKLSGANQARFALAWVMEKRDFLVTFLT